MTARATYVSIHPDELALPGETWEHTIDFAAEDDGGATVTDTRDVCVYVPSRVRTKDDTTVGAAHDAVILWTANRVVGDTKFNDTLNLGLRASAEATDRVLICLPSPGDHAKVPFSKPDFCVFGDADIAACFTAVGLKGTVGKLRLVSHSRGHRGLTRSLMGNRKIGNTNASERDPEFATIGTSFIATSSVERIVYLDNFFDSGHRILGRLVGGGLSSEALRVYHVTDGRNITDKTIVKDLATQYIDLEPIGETQLAAIGCERALMSALGRYAAQSDSTVADKVFANPPIMKLALAKQLPPRGTFSSSSSPPSGQLELAAWSKKNVYTFAEATALLRFLNAEKLLRDIGTYQFGTMIAAHHFFVAELAHELFT